MSRISTCLEAANHFLLDQSEAIAIVVAQIQCITEHWVAVCDEAQINETDRSFLWGRQFLNAFAFEGLDGDAELLTEMVRDIH